MAFGFKGTGRGSRFRVSRVLVEGSGSINTSSLYGSKMQEPGDINKREGGRRLLLDWASQSLEG